MAIDVCYTLTIAINLNTTEFATYFRVAYGEDN